MLAYNVECHVHLKCRSDLKCKAKIQNEIVPEMATIEVNGKRVPAAGRQVFNFRSPFTSHDHHDHCVANDSSTQAEVFEAEHRFRCLNQPQIKSSRHYLDVQSAITNPDVAALFGARHRLVASANRLKRRREVFPEQLATVAELFDVICSWQADDSQTENIDRFFVSKDGHFLFDFQITSDEGDGFVILTTDSQLTRLSKAERWFMDGTFDIAPSLFQQLWTINYIYRGVGHPAVFVLSTDKSSATYEKFFDSIMARLTMLNPNFQWREATSDFESGLLPVLRSVNIEENGIDVNIKIIGCWFLYTLTYMWPVNCGAPLTGLLYGRLKKAHNKPACYTAGLGRRISHGHYIRHYIRPV